MAEPVVKEREFVVPGDLLVQSMDYLPGRNCFRDGESILAKRLGIVSIKNRVISIIPLNAVYMPKLGDMVIGTVEEIQSNGWIVGINAPYDSFLPLSGVRGYIDTNRTDLASIYDIGDALYAKIIRVARNSVAITMQDMMSKKFKSGRIVNMNPAKIPRVIGRQGSMISMIKRATGTWISVGQNGLIWFEGGNEGLVLKALEMIDKEAYLEGLTERVAKLLGVEPEPKVAETEEKAGPAAEGSGEEQFGSENGMKEGSYVEEGEQ